MAVFAGQSPLFDVENLLEAKGMARLRGVASSEERANAFKGKFRADHPSSNAEHIHVVMLDTLSGRVGVVAERSAYAGDLVGCNAHSNAATADQNPTVDFPRKDRQRNSLGKIGEIASFAVVRAAIHDFDIGPLQKLNDLLFHSKSCVVSPDCVAKWRSGICIHWIAPKNRTKFREDQGDGVDVNKGG